MHGCLVIGNDDVFVRKAEGINIIRQPVQEGLFAHLQQRLGEGRRQRVLESSAVLSQDQILHRITAYVKAYPRL